MSERGGMVLLVTITNKIVPVQHAYSMNTYSRITTAHEGVTEISERAHEWRAWVLHIIFFRNSFIFRFYFGLKVPTEIPEISKIQCSFVTKRMIIYFRKS